MFALLALFALVGLVSGDTVGHNRILNFPTASIENYISYNPGLPALTGVTVCTWKHKTLDDSGRYWFSYAGEGSPNEIVVGEREGKLIFHLASGGNNFADEHTVTVEADDGLGKWVHVCAAWDSATGVATISLDGEIKTTRENFKQGISLKEGGNVVIGQDQDEVGGGFVDTQSFVGELYNMNIWDYALNSSEVAYLFETEFCGFGTTDKDPIISWEDLLEQDKAGGVTEVSGHCIDLEDPSEGKILRFPPQSEASIDNYLQFSPDFGVDELEALSVCTWLYKTYSDEQGFFFSYAVTDQANSIILGEFESSLEMRVENYELKADLFLKQHRWYHLCFTWASDSGAAIYVDGEQVKAQDDLAAGKSVPTGGLLNIGQEQDTLGGSFDVKQAFAGSLYNLNMFNIKLSDDQVAELYGEGTFCEKVPDEMWQAGNLMIPYETLYSVPVHGDVVFESGEAAWRHGGMHCAKEDESADALKPECWKTEERTRYQDKGTLGYIVGDVDAAKAACYAYDKCKTLTCLEKNGEMKCEMKDSFEKAKRDKRKTSYTYRC